MAVKRGAPARPSPDARPKTAGRKAKADQKAQRPKNTKRSAAKAGKPAKATAGAAKATRLDAAPAPEAGSKGGRPTAYRPEYAKQAAKLCELGATDLELAQFFEVAVSTVYLWRVTHPAFSEAVKRGKAVADEIVEQRLFARATGYSHDAVKIFLPKDAAEPVYAPYVEHHAPDTTAAIFWLKNRKPGEWKDRNITAVEPGDGLLDLLGELDGATGRFPRGA